MIIVKLFGVCPVVFSLQRERIFHVNICIFVYDSYFGLLMFVIILFGTQHLGIKKCLRICVRLEVVLCNNYLCIYYIRVDFIPRRFRFLWEGGCLRVPDTFDFFFFFLSKHLIFFLLWEMLYVIVTQNN